MEKIKQMKRMDWRQKLLISILGSFILIMSLLFYSTYHYFVNKIEKSNEKVVLLTFEQAEQDLKKMLKTVELCLDKYVTDDSVWKFGCEYPNDDIDESRLMVTLKKKFCDEMTVNGNLAALGILRGDGKGIVSSADGRNRSGETIFSEGFTELLLECKNNYPYTIWVPSWEMELDDLSPISLMMQTPSLIGIKATGESDAIKDEIFLFASINESSIGSTFESVTFNNSTAVLLDKNEQIISCVGENLLNRQYSIKKNIQNIEYPLSFYDWKLCNMIPKQEYMKDINDIRNFGIAVITAAIIITVIVFVVWSKKYTRPIELLMQNMDFVKRQKFNIEKPEKLGWEELDRLNLEFYFMAKSTQSYIERLKDAEREKTKEELLALQYQMNPHFLLNSLNSIRWMAMMTNNAIVADTLVKLSRIITPMLRNPSLTWQISDEIEFLENYVSMMHLRYGHDMEYHMDCPKEYYDKEFPRLILQPLIENCFVHGSKQGEIRSIDVLIRCDDYMEIKVINSGIFMSEEKLEDLYKKMQTAEKATDNVGLVNVYRRLKLLYGKFGYIHFDTDSHLGFVVHICIPEKTAMFQND